MNPSTLRLTFQRAQAAYLKALNATKPDAVWIASLYQHMNRARDACREAGVLIETFEEFCDREHSQAQTYVRALAASELPRTPLISRRLRFRMAASTGVFVTATALYACLTANLGVLAAVLSVVGGLMTFAMVDGLLLWFFPTPIARVAYVASGHDTDVSDMWPPDSAAHQEYRKAYALHRVWMNNFGQHSQWIRFRR